MSRSEWISNRAKELLKEWSAGPEMGAEAELQAAVELEDQ